MSPLSVFFFRFLFPLQRTNRRTRKPLSQSQISIASFNFQEFFYFPISSSQSQVKFSQYNHTMTPRKLLVFFIFLIIYNLSCSPSLVSPENVNLEFPFFTLQNLTLVGDSRLSPEWSDGLWG
ncbi:hypothetical protein Pfo_013471 [Paulownia fortunei]|nr:hypothetical protein Pfo_013471 [Paulownia fortunei]